MDKKSIFITVIVAIIVASAAFFGGMKYQQTKANTLPTQFAQSGNMRFGQAGRFNKGSMATVGKIISSDSNSITLQLQDGSSKIVNISGNTRIVKTQTAALSDLTNGTSVAVFGSTNSDGSITAQNVQVNPMNFRVLHTSVTPNPTQ